MKVIAISREFGSGGRELGRRLADALGFAYYDREIIMAVAERCALDEKYVERAMETGLIRQYPLTFSRTFSHMPALIGSTAALLPQQHSIVKELAEQGDCVIVGRGADVVLQSPFKIFVYADMEARMARCRSRADPAEQLADRELERKIRQIDKARAEQHNLLSGCAWGEKRGYHLCVNTTGVAVKSIAPAVADYVRQWFEKEKV